MARTVEYSRRAWALRLAAAAGAYALATPLALAARQPTGPVTIIVPYTAGNNTPDILARLIGRELQQQLGRPVVIENKPGASGNIGTEAAARSAPDGRTLLMVGPAFVQNVGLYKKLPYDPAKDFTPIIEVAQIPIGLVVNAALPPNSTREFIDYVKSRPGKLNYSSPGYGTPHHLSMELFKLATGINIKHIPYRGAAPAIQDLVSGRVSAMFLPLPPALPLARAHKIKLLAVADKDRASAAPDVPTLAEQGIKVEVGVWNGLVAPAGTPPAIVDRYNRIVNDILRSPQIAERLKKQSVNVVGGTPEQFGVLIRSELAKWRKVVSDAGIHMN